MNRLIALSLMLTISLPVPAGELAAKNNTSHQVLAFVKLSNALAFIDQKLDKEDWEGLTQALYPPYVGEPNRTSWKQLKAERGKLRLADIFSHQDFSDRIPEPVNINGTPASTYTIGSSNIVGAKFIGWSRIRFIKVDQGWCIYAIYGVR